MDIVSNFAMPIVFKKDSDYCIYKDKFEKAKVEIRPIIAGDIGKQPFFHKYVNNISSCPNADLIHKQGFYFGNNPEMTKDEVNILCNLLF